MQRPNAKPKFQIPIHNQTCNLPPRPKKIHYPSIQNHFKSDKSPHLSLIPIFMCQRFDSGTTPTGMSSSFFMNSPIQATFLLLWLPRPIFQILRARDRFPESVLCLRREAFLFLLEEVDVPQASRAM